MVGVGFNEVEDTGATVDLVVNVGIEEVDVQGGLEVVGTWQTSFFGKAPTIVPANDTISTSNGRNLCIANNIVFVGVKSLGAANDMELAPFDFYLLKFASSGA